VSLAVVLVSVATLAHGPEAVDTNVQTIPEPTWTPRNSALPARTARAPLEELPLFTMVRLTFIVVSAAEAVALLVTMAVLYRRRVSCGPESMHWSAFDESFSVVDPPPNTPPSESSSMPSLSSTEDDENILY
jgi:hypothetical protein